MNSPPVPAGSREGVATARETSPGSSEPPTGPPASFLDYEEGMPVHGATIKDLLHANSSFVVYITDKPEVVYETARDLTSDRSQEANNWLRRADLLQSLPLSHLQTDQRDAFLEMLGHGMIAALNENIPAASEVVTRSEGYLSARSKEIAKWQHFAAATPVAAGVLLFFFVLWIIGTKFSNPDYEHVLEFFAIITAGTTGAYLFLLSRLNRLATDPNSGLRMHRIDAITRLIVGAIGAYVVALGFKSKLIFGFLELDQADKTPVLMYLLCIVAGASERLVPNFIQSVESHSGDQADSPRGENPAAR